MILLPSYFHVVCVQPVHHVVRDPPKRQRMNCVRIPPDGESICFQCEYNYIRNRNIKTMQIQYIYDTTGKKTGVIIPIDEWEDGEEMTIEAGRLSGFNPASYRGLLRGMKDRIERELARMRAEWEHR